MAKQWRTKIPPRSLIPYLAMLVGLYGLHNAWAAFAIYHGMIVVFVSPTRDRHLWSGLCLGWQWRPGLGSVLFGLGGGVVLGVLAPAAGINRAMLEPILADLGLQGPIWLLFICYHALVNPWFEELLWRGKLGSDSRRPVLNDMLFAGYHVLVLILFLDWVWILAAFPILTGAGWLWRQLRRRGRGLLMPVISHLAADAGIMAAVYVIGR